jgi:Uma2 family endonuclease
MIGESGGSITIEPDGEVPPMSIAPGRKKQRIKLGPGSNGMLMTPEEFDAVTDYDDQYVYELIHGVLIVSPMPGESERDPNGELEFLLRQHQYNHPRGSVLDKTLGEQYIALPDSRRRADRVLWCGLGRVPDPRTDVPTIVAEFVSKRKRDRVRDYEEKRREFAAVGVAEYWVIDRFDRTMTVFKNLPGEPSEAVVKAEETYRTPLLPGFELPLARLLKVADDWAQSAARRKRPSRRKPAQ